MYQNRDIKEGMTVRSIDGHKLGKVYAVDEREFHIEKGLFFPKDYSVRYGEISEIRGSEIILAHGNDSLRSFSDSLNRNADSLAQRQGLGSSRTDDLSASWEKPRVQRKGLRTQDLGDQEIGPFNTEGARASPILTEEDRASHLPYVPPASSRPVMNASPDDWEVGASRTEQPLRSVEVDDDLYEPRRLSRSELEEQDKRNLDLSAEDDLTRRGY